MYIQIYIIFNVTTLASKYKKRQTWLNDRKIGDIVILGIVETTNDQPAA